MNVFRPEEELAEIFKGQILPVQAKVLWLQPPLRSAIGRHLAEANNMAFVEGVAIAEVAAGI